MSTYRRDINTIQREIFKIRDNAQPFEERLSTIFPETVYQNMLLCDPPLTMLANIINGTGEEVISAPIIHNFSEANRDAKKEELSKLRREIVDLINRLLAVMKWHPLQDLLSGYRRVFQPRNKMYFLDVYDEVTMEDELEYQRLQDEPTYYYQNSSDESEP
ncbi:hypothetical protein RND81_14G049900 [Saponaria officinalis]|uniref:Uncharacterized protein n=1 Tax=Saponaria officinalis TaxID=3572 RepID=A0AAW1GLK3_SAPOF